MLSTAAVVFKTFNKARFNILLTVYIKAFKLKAFNNYTFIYFVILILNPL